MTGPTNLLIKFSVLIYRLDNAFLLFYSIILISLSFNKHQRKLEIESFVNSSILEHSNEMISPRPRPQSAPSHSQSDPVVWSQLRFPQGFLKGKQTALNCSCAFFNCRWSCQTICSISHGKQYKLIYGLPGWHNSPERLKAFLYLSTLWPSFWAAEAKDNCAHLSQSCWSERKESCRTPIRYIVLATNIINTALQLVHRRVYFTFLWQNISKGDVE